MIARASAALLCACASVLPAGADAQLATSPGIQGSQVLDQRSADFALQLRQSQQAVELQRIAPGDVRSRAEMEALHLQQRQRLDDVQSRQRLEAQLRALQPANPAAGSAEALYQRERGRIEERLLTDQFGRQRDEQVRAAERQQAENERPRLGPTIDP